MSDRPTITVAAIVLRDCRTIGFGVYRADGGCELAMLVARTDVRIDVHRWEEILNRHVQNPPPEPSLMVTAALREACERYGGSPLVPFRAIDGGTLRDGRTVDLPAGEA